MDENKVSSLPERFQQLLNQSGGGDDEKLLDLASSFSVQLSAAQIRVLLSLNFFSDMLLVDKQPEMSAAVRSFVKKYIELKKYHGSDFFVMRALDSVSLRKFMHDRPIGVDVIKK